MRRFTVEVHSFLRIKGGVTGESVHAPMQSNSMYVHKVIRSVYDTRGPEHPQFPIRRCE